MATVDDIDTTAAVRKYLDRQVVVSNTQEGQDQGEEVAAVLEAVAISFLLNPQAALTLVLMAKNQLQQVVSKDLDLLDFLSKAVNDVSNPDTAVTDLSDLTEAQTALVEIDKLGSFDSSTRAFEKYTAAVNRFLNQQLARSLKRRGLGEFERSGNEARQDLSNGLGLFGSTHSVMSDLLAALSTSVDNFRGVDLTKIVSATTVARVRSSLTKIQQGFQTSGISKTVAAIELIAGSSSLQSISNARDVYDPTIETGAFPKDRNIVVSSESAPAFVDSGDGDFNVFGASNTNVNLVIDAPGDALSVSAGVPIAGGPGGRAWIAGTPTSSAFTLPGGSKKLYFTIIGVSTTLLEVDLTAFSVFDSTALTTVNAALGANATGYIHLRADGRSEILFVGGASATSITIRDGGNGSVDAMTGVYTAPAQSVHSALGFQGNQSSTNRNVVTAQQLADRLNAYLGSRAVATVRGSSVRVVSSEAGPASGVRVLSSTFAGFGFSPTPATSLPLALLLLEGGQSVDPQSVGVFVGSRVLMADALNDSSRSGVMSVISIDGDRMLFDPGVVLPRGLNRNVTVLAPAVASVQDLLRRIQPFVGIYSSDATDLQRVSAPLLSLHPTPAQIGDALRVLSSLKTKIQSLMDVLSSIVVRDDQSNYAATAKNILQGLDERGLDQATDLLKAADFGGFFALTTEAASKSGAFLKAIENVMTTTFKTSTIESEIEDVKPTGAIPDGTLATLEPSTDAS